MQINCYKQNTLTNHACESDSDYDSDSDDDSSNLVNNIVLNSEDDPEIKYFRPSCKALSLCLFLTYVHHSYVADNSTRDLYVAQ